jgi:hypothetical protein
MWDYAENTFIRVLGGIGSLLWGGDCFRLGRPVQILEERPENVYVGAGHVDSFFQAER